jgi:hypothetical protein
MRRAQARATGARLPGRALADASAERWAWRASSGTGVAQAKGARVRFSNMDARGGAGGGAEVEKESCGRVRSTAA